MVNKGDIVICIKVDDSNHLTLNQRYIVNDLIDMTDMKIVQINMISGEGLGFYSLDNFITLSEYRNQKIKNIGC